MIISFFFLRYEYFRFSLRFDSKEAGIQALRGKASQDSVEFSFSIKFYLYYHSEIFILTNFYVLKSTNYYSALVKNKKRMRDIQIYEYIISEYIIYIIPIFIR